MNIERGAIGVLSQRQKHEIRSPQNFKRKRKKRKRKPIRFTGGWAALSPSRHAFPLICTSAIYSSEPTNYVENGEEFASTAHATHARRAGAYYAAQGSRQRQSGLFISRLSWPKAQRTGRKKIATRKGKKGRKKSRI